MSEGGGKVVVKEGRSLAVKIKWANNEKIGQSAALAMRPKGLC